MNLHPFGEKIELQSVISDDGALTICEPFRIGLFDVKRVYFIHSMSSKAHRGGHAHRELHQLIIAATGRFVLNLEQFGKSKSVELESPNVACYVPPWTWRDITSFSDNAVCLVLASDHYSEGDYIRDFEEFTIESQERFG